MTPARTTYRDAIGAHRANLAKAAVDLATRPAAPAPTPASSTGTQTRACHARLAALPLQ